MERKLFTKQLEYMCTATKSLFSKRGNGVYKNTVNIEGNMVILCYSKAKREQIKEILL